MTARSRRWRAMPERNRRFVDVSPTTLYPHQWLWDSCFIARRRGMTD
jgi:hypothetical protein